MLGEPLMTYLERVVSQKDERYRCSDRHAYPQRTEALREITQPFVLKGSTKCKDGVETIKGDKGGISGRAGSGPLPRCHCLTTTLQL